MNGVSVSGNLFTWEAVGQWAAMRRKQNSAWEDYSAREQPEDRETKKSVAETTIQVRVNPQGREDGGRRGI